LRNFYRLMLGRRSAFAADCFARGFVGVDFGIPIDLTGRLPDEWRAFNKEFIPIYLAAFPEKSKIAAGLACGVTWTACKGIALGDVMLCPDGSGSYRVGEVTGDYRYAPGESLPYQRAVTWLPVTIKRGDMSEALQGSTGSIGTISDVSRYRDEIELLMGGATPPKIVVADPTVEDPASFVLEKHLEDFLVANWAQTELGKTYDIYQEEGQLVGQQYATDTGPVDILAISKDKKELLVVELKKGRASDAVVGQVLRYMGFMTQELAEPGQTVRGVVIALDDDQRMRRALVMTPNVSFYRYQVSFKLVKG
jgi:restriction system protein